MRAWWWRRMSNDFAGHTDSTSADVKVILAPPRVVADDAQHYINQGGMELAVMTPGGSWNEAGVKVGKYTFRSFPLPGPPGAALRHVRLSLGPAGQPYAAWCSRATWPARKPPRQFWFKLFPKKFRIRDFPIDDALMAKLVNQIDPDGTLAPGPDMLSRFLKINGEMRRKNNQQLADLRLKTEEKILWNGPFLHWGKEESMFADVRNYIYHGKKVDQQVHLGFDLSDTANAPVHVANDGRVVWAADLGIYGNCVVVDHGYALAIHLRPHESHRREGGRHGKEGPEPRRRGSYRTGRRRPRSLQHADRWRAGESARVVGRTLDPRSDHEQVGSECRPGEACGDSRHGDQPAPPPPPKVAPIRAATGYPLGRERLVSSGPASPHHTRQAFWLTIGCPALHENAFWNSGEFCNVPFTR